jgi:hypothetical protein
MKKLNKLLISFILGVGFGLLINIVRPAPSHIDFKARTKIVAESLMTSNEDGERAFVLALTPNIGGGLIAFLDDAGERVKNPENSENLHKIKWVSITLKDGRLFRFPMKYKTEINSLLIRM